MKRTSLKNLRLLACLGVSIACLAAGRAWGEDIVYIDDGSAIPQSSAPTDTNSFYFAQNTSGSNFLPQNQASKDGQKQSPAAQQPETRTSGADAVGPSNPNGGGSNKGKDPGSSADCPWEGQKVEMGCESYNKRATDSPCCCENDVLVKCGGGGAGGAGRAGDPASDSTSNSKDNSTQELPSASDNNNSDNSDSGRDSELTTCPSGQCRKPPTNNPPSGTTCGSSEPCCAKPVENRPDYCHMVLLDCQCQP